MKAIIFDFDGVIVNTDPPRFKSLQNSAEKVGLEIKDDQFKSMLGKTSVVFIDEIFPEVDLIKKEVLFNFYTRDFRENFTKIVEPMYPTIDFIKKYSGNLELSIASMNRTESIESVLDYYQIKDKIKAIVSKDEVTKNKPDPEVYLKMIEKLRLTPADCYAIEDTVIGVNAALSAGTKCYVFLNGVNNEKEFGSMKISGFLKTTEDFDKFLV